MEIAPETVLRRARRAVQGELPDEMVLLDIEDGVGLRLNASGTWLWKRLEQPASVDELASGLASRFGIEEARALGDVTAFARELSRRGLLEPA